jgi:hypothetical protein
MKRLLKRLDSAPVQWQQMGQMAHRSDELSRAALLVSKAVGPFRPYLVTASQSPSWAVAGRVPLVGGVARMAQDNLSNLVLLDQGFESLVKADQRHLAPLRAAALSAARLQRTRSRNDVPAVARHFRAAAQILGEDETSLRVQRSRLMLVQSKWPLLESVASRYAPVGSLSRGSMSLAKTQLNSALGLVDNRLEQMTETRDWLQIGAIDAQAAS